MRKMTSTILAFKLCFHIHIIFEIPTVCIASDNEDYKIPHGCFLEFFEHDTKLALIIHTGHLFVYDVSTFHCIHTYVILYHLQQKKYFSSLLAFL